MERRIIPAFATEAEEAQWWYDHREELAQDFIDGAKEGRLGEGSKARFARHIAENRRPAAEASELLQKAT